MTLCRETSRLAVIITGECRTFRHATTQHSFARNLLAASEADVRVFASLTDQSLSHECKKGLGHLNVTAFVAAPQLSFNPSCVRQDFWASTKVIVCWDHGLQSEAFMSVSARFHSIPSACIPSDISLSSCVVLRP